MKMKACGMALGLLALAGCSVNLQPELDTAVYGLEREHKCFIASPALERREMFPKYGYVLADQPAQTLVWASGIYIDLNEAQRQEAFKKGILALHNGNVCL